MAFAAELRTEDFDADTVEARGTGRRRLNLGASAWAGPNVAPVLIHNISTSGMLLESSVALAGQDSIEIEIPEAGTFQASIMWASDQFYGCQFEQPLSRAALSAALLRSPASNAQDIPAPTPFADLETPFAAEVAQPRDPNAYSLRKKAAITVALATLAWVPVLVAISLIA